MLIESLAKHWRDSQPFKLLIETQSGCPGGASLLWFNPATHAEQWLLRAPAESDGVIGVVPYNSTENAQPL